MANLFTDHLQISIFIFIFASFSPPKEKKKASGDKKNKVSKKKWTCLVSLHIISVSYYPEIIDDIKYDWVKLNDNLIPSKYYLFFRLTFFFLAVPFNGGLPCMWQCCKKSLSLFHSISFFSSPHNSLSIRTEDENREPIKSIKKRWWKN